jgi:UDP-N-acetylglucosamine 2-epimerase
MNLLAETYKHPIIVSTHPRTRNRMQVLDNISVSPLVTFMKPFGFLDYIRLQMSAFCILSDSGTITEEASLLNLPAITIRNAHERPEGINEGTLIMSGLKPERILDAVAMVVAQHDDARRNFAIVKDYEKKCVSKQIARVILSYTDYISRTIWHRS